MKSLAAALLSVAVILTAWGIFVNYSDQNIHKMTHSIDDKILKSIHSENWDLAEDQFSKLAERWHHQKRIYTYFFNTAEINNTDYAIARTEKYIEERDAALSSGELNSIKEQLGFLHANELATIDNIF